MGKSSSKKQAKQATKQAASDALASRQQQANQWEEQKAVTAEQKAQERMLRLQGLRSASFDRERAAAMRGTLGFKSFQGQGGRVGAYRNYANKFAWAMAAQNPAAAAATAMSAPPADGQPVITEAPAAGSGGPLPPAISNKVKAKAPAPAPAQEPMKKSPYSKAKKK